jgi:hypothetical protein
VRTGSLQHFTKRSARCGALPEYLQSMRVKKAFGLYRPTHIPPSATPPVLQADRPWRAPLSAIRYEGF